MPAFDASECDGDTAARFRLSSTSGSINNRFEKCGRRVVLLKGAYSTVLQGAFETSGVAFLDRYIEKLRYGLQEAGAAAEP